MILFYLVVQSDDLASAQAKRLEDNQPDARLIVSAQGSHGEAAIAQRGYATVAVKKAYEAMHALNVEVHYPSCESGIGRKLRSD